MPVYTVIYCVGSLCTTQHNELKFPIKNFFEATTQGLNLENRTAHWCPRNDAIGDGSEDPPTDPVQRCSHSPINHWLRKKKWNIRLKVLFITNLFLKTVQLLGSWGWWGNHQCRKCPQPGWRWLQRKGLVQSWSVLHSTEVRYHPGWVWWQ